MVSRSTFKRKGQRHWQRQTGVLGMREGFDKRVGGRQGDGILESGNYKLGQHTVKRKARVPSSGLSGPKVERKRTDGPRESFVQTNVTDAPRT